MTLELVPDERHSKQAEHPPKVWPYERHRWFWPFVCVVVIGAVALGMLAAL